VTKKQPQTAATRNIALTRRIVGANVRYQEAAKALKELQIELAARASLEKIKKIIVPHKYKISKTSQKEAVAVGVASDWHIDEEVKSEEIGGLNEFNLDIAIKRSEIFFTRFLKLLELCRNGSTINTAVLALLGDFMSGWIHPDLIESSSLTPPESLIKVYELLLGGIKFVVDKGNLKELIIVGACGNHGRITKKRRYKKSAQKTYEWIIYEFIARSLAGTKYSNIVKFQLPKGYFNRLQVYDFNIRFHHGDRVNYRDGVGGVHVPLRKAIAQWNKAIHADIDVLGHWHCREPSESYVINGCLIGYSEFAEGIKADYQTPRQSFFLLHPKYGKTAEFPIILE
jgi:hypothetical protein